MVTFCCWESGWHRVEGIRYIHLVGARNPKKKIAKLLHSRYNHLTVLHLLDSLTWIPGDI